jgi:hypothetical protein
MLKVDATLPVAGAIIEEETGLMKVNNDTIIVAAHLRLKLQLWKNCEPNTESCCSAHANALFGILRVIWAVPVNNQNICIIRCRRQPVITNVIRLLRMILDWNMMD